MPPVVQPGVGCLIRRKLILGQLNIQCLKQFKKKKKNVKGHDSRGPDLCNIG